MREPDVAGAVGGLTAIDHGEEAIEAARVLTQMRLNLVQPWAGHLALQRSAPAIRCGDGRHARRRSVCPGTGDSFLSRNPEINRYTSRPMSLPATANPPSIRPIVLLSVAAFASAATLRVADPVIPQLVTEFGVTAGSASVVATAFAMSYGLCQILVGPLGDRFGKYAVVVAAVFLCSITASAAAFSPSLAVLAATRLASGCTAGAIIPLSMAYLGDVVPYESRQTVLARFLSGQILGVIGGQVFGGLFGDLIGWRGIFIVLGGLYLVIALLLLHELRSSRVDRRRQEAQGSHGLLMRYLTLLQIARVRSLVATVFIEGFLFFGGFVYIGAYLRHNFTLSYSTVGLLIASFGLGGLGYAFAVRILVARLGERGLALAGGSALCIGFVLAAVAPTPWCFPPIMVVIGTGFYMLHNTLQTNATQMAPHERGFAISIFAFCYFLGQAFGVWACGSGIDAVGYVPIFVTTGGLLLVLAAIFRRSLPKPVVAAT
jgi:YNFM family putative membrane transporter